MHPIINREINKGIIIGLIIKLSRALIDTIYMAVTIRSIDPKNSTRRAALSLIFITSPSINILSLYAVSFNSVIIL